MKKIAKKIVVGISGGVDSSVALVLLKEQGWEPVAVMLRLPVWSCGACKENICCTKESRETAKKVCKKLGAPYHVVDVRQQFANSVVKYFVSEFQRGRTPNPCVFCNRYLKFEHLFAFAKKQGIKYVATGHYARIYDGKLKVSKDTVKDQTYTLSYLKKNWLDKSIFPIGEYTKEQVYKIAQDNGLKVYKKMPQSQDFCYVSGKDLPKFLQQKIGRKSGEIRDLDENVLGKHSGFFLYTIGQRKGIGFAGGPWYVAKLDAKKNLVYVTKNARDLDSKEFFVRKINWLEKLTRFPARVKVKIRAAHKPVFGRVYADGKIVLEKPARAVTSGQYAVLYRRGQVIGAGEIV